jgi:hypothetical protein
MRAASPIGGHHQQRDRDGGSDQDRCPPPTWPSLSLIVPGPLQHLGPVSIVGVLGGSCEPLAEQPVDSIAHRDTSLRSSASASAARAWARAAATVPSLTPHASAISA